MNNCNCHQSKTLTTALKQSLQALKDADRGVIRAYNPIPGVIEATELVLQKYGYDMNGGRNEQ